jgi:hypothetical protein
VVVGGDVVVVEKDAVVVVGVVQIVDMVEIQVQIVDVVEVEIQIYLLGSFVILQKMGLSC